MFDFERLWKVDMCENFEKWEVQSQQNAVYWQIRLTGGGGNTDLKELDS